MNLRFSHERKRLLRLAARRRTSIEAIKADEAAALERLRAHPWLGQRLDPPVEPDHPSLAA